MTNPERPNAAHIRCVFTSQKAKVDGLIVTAVWRRVQDGDDFNEMSDRHVRTGLPDGRIVRGWQTQINCDVIIEPCKDLYTYNLVIDGKEYVVNEVIEGRWHDSKTNKTIVSVSAARYDEDFKIIRYHD